MNTPLETKTKPPANAASAPAHPGLLQRKCACGGSPGIAGGCQGCSNKQLNLQPSDAREADSFAVPSNALGGVLRAPGQPLEAQARAFTKPRFGHDFSRITLHDPARNSGLASWRPAPADSGGSASMHKTPQRTGARSHASTNSMAGGVKPAGMEDEELFIGGNGRDSENLSYRESNELLECIRIMGQENAEYCREQARNPENWGTHSAIVATETTTAGPTYTPCGEFLWQTAFATSGRNGFLVQEITNVYQASTCAGAVIANPRPTPVYYEAWQVDGSGNVTPNPTGTNDWWLRPARPNTRGHWSMTGKVHWAATLEPAANFVFRGVPDAGDAMSTLTKPTNIANPILTRQKGGTWDCCGGSNTHTPA